MLADGMTHGFFLWSITTKVAPDVIAVLLGRLGTAGATGSRGLGEGNLMNTDPGTGDFGAFEGVRVVELAQWVFVPVAGALLADWGADVIRIERPEGDPYRGLATQGIGTDSGGVNLSMALANRGKRSMALDLRSRTARRCCTTCSRPPTCSSPTSGPVRSTAGPRRRRRPRAVPALVYARGHGYGVRGPDADRAGYDASAFWARGGARRTCSRRPSASTRSTSAARWATATAGWRCVRHRRRAAASASAPARVRWSTCRCSATAMWTLSSDLLTALQGPQPRAPGGGCVVNPLVGTYRTKDGRHIQLVFLQSDRYWADFCAADRTRRPRRRSALRRPRCPRRQRRGLRRGARRRVRRPDVRGVEGAARQIDAPWAPVQAVEELLDDPQVVANGYIGEVAIEGGPTYRLPRVPVQFDERPPELRRAPEHGEHTEAVLLELGHTGTTSARCRRRGVIP